MNAKSITFLMPSNGSKGPAGGYKVVYEYANRLASDGYKVHIAYPLTMNFSRYSFKQKLRVVPRLISWMINGVSCSKWFKLDDSVKEHLVLGLCQCFVPKTTYYVATGVKTAYYLSQYTNVPKGNMLYLIQGFENWGVSDEYVYNSYLLGLKNIVISNWLAEKVDEVSAKYTLIKNGFDFKYFKLNTQIELRKPHSIAMMYHTNPLKGAKYGIEAIAELKKKYPDLSVSMFGTPPRPDFLPTWITYYQKPNQEQHNKIYNESAVYLAPSLSEGWGLTVGEAMICGAAIVCTETLGFREMVNDNETGLIAPIHDSKALAEKVDILFSDNTNRINLAKAGNESIQKFKWDESYQLLKDLLL